MTDAVSAALAAARANADNAVVNTPVVAPVGVVPSVMPQGRVRTLADVADTYVERSELFIKVTEIGMYIGDDFGCADELFGTIKLSEVRFPSMCRYQVAGQTKYLRTYDGVREATSGKSWGQAIAEAQSIDQKADIYDSVEFALNLTKVPVKRQVKKGDLVEVPVGSRVGYTASKTGFDAVTKYITAAFKEHGADAEVAVRAYHIAKKRGSNEWGIVGLEAAPSTH